MLSFLFQNSTLLCRQNRIFVDTSYFLKIAVLSPILSTMHLSTTALTFTEKQNIPAILVFVWKTACKQNKYPVWTINNEYEIEWFSATKMVMYQFNCNLFALTLKERQNDEPSGTPLITTGIQVHMWSQWSLHNSILWGLPPLITTGIHYICAVSQWGLQGLLLWGLTLSLP